MLVPKYEAYQRTPMSFSPSCTPPFRPLLPPRSSLKPRRVHFLQVEFYGASNEPSCASVAPRVAEKTRFRPNTRISPQRQQNDTHRAGDAFRARHCTGPVQSHLLSHRQFASCGCNCARRTHGNAWSVGHPRAKHSLRTKPHFQRISRPVAIRFEAGLLIRGMCRPEQRARTRKSEDNGMTW